MNLDLSTILWLLPVAFVFHDLEEVICVESFMTRHRTRIEQTLPKRLAATVIRQFSMTTAQFALAVLVVFLFLSTATFWSVTTGNLLPFLVCLTVFFVHAFTHIGQSLLFRTVTPGAVTSVLVVIPYSMFAYTQLFHQQWINGSDIRHALPWVLLVFPILLLAHAIGKKWA